MVAGRSPPPARDRGADHTTCHCDNLPDNGAVVARVVGELADRVEPGLREWLEASVATVTTMVDRITPRTTAEDLLAGDHCPVITSRSATIWRGFPGGRPRWEDAGATFTDDIAPFEERKLWLLNGGHSLLAYAGSARGHETVAEAVADDTCRGWLETWWAEAFHVRRWRRRPWRTIATRCSSTSNPRMRHRLAQIAADGSQKLPMRSCPCCAPSGPRGASRTAPCACSQPGSAVRGAGAPVADPPAAELVALRTSPEGVRRILEEFDPALAADDALVASIMTPAR